MSVYKKLLENYADARHLTMTESKIQVDACFAAIRDTLAEPDIDTLTIRNFGRFRIISYKARSMKNNLGPTTQHVYVPPSERVSFSASPLLRSIIQKPRK